MPVQIQRLLELQNYVHGGVSEWPAPAQEPAMKEEMQVPEPTGNNRPVLNPDAGMEPFQDVKPEPPQTGARAPAPMPVSKWTLAEDLDAEQSAIPVSKWVAQEVRQFCVSMQVQKDVKQSICTALESKHSGTQKLCVYHGNLSLEYRGHEMLC